MADLMGAKEVAEYVGLTKESIYVYKSQGKMPPIDVELSGRGYWLPDTIETWATTSRVGRFRYGTPR